MSKLRACKNERRFELDSRPKNAVGVQPAAAAHVSARGNERASPDDRRTFDDRPFFYRRGEVNRNIAVQPVAGTQSVQKPLQDTGRGLRQLPRRRPPPTEIASLAFLVKRPALL